MLLVQHGSFIRVREERRCRIPAESNARKNNVMTLRVSLISLAAAGLAVLIIFLLIPRQRVPKDKVLAVDVGLKSQAGFTPLLKKGSRLPTSCEQVFSTSGDNQPGVTLTLLSRDPTANNVTRLGEFDIDGIEPAARGVPLIHVTVTVTESGMVTVAALDQDSGNSRQMEFGPVQIQEQ